MSFGMFVMMSHRDNPAHFQDSKYKKQHFDICLYFNDCFCFFAQHGTFKINTISSSVLTAVSHSHVHRLAGCSSANSDPVLITSLLADARQNSPPYVPRLPAVLHESLPAKDSAGKLGWTGREKKSQRDEDEDPVAIIPN